MHKVGLYSLLLIVGLVLSQLVPSAVGPSYAALEPALRVLTMTALAFIMIQVGYEFDIDKRRLRASAFDYLVAMTAAAFPWLFCAAYFVLVMAPPERWTSVPFWKDMLLLSRFAAPTSAGVLFTMLAAAGLTATWVFRKARVLAIFDDVDTILLLIPLQMLMVGLKWQLFVMILVVGLVLWVAWHWLHALPLPGGWPWVLGYALVLAGVCEGVDQLLRHSDPTTPLRLEILLPAFAVGCVMAHPRPGSEAERALARPVEQRVATVVSACFMLLAGASMPVIGAGPDANTFPSWGVMALHILALTLLSNLGKLFPALCYRREAAGRERLALGVSLFPRGEVGTGVLVIAVGYGIGGPALAAATLSLTLNLIGTGLFIVTVKRLLVGLPTRPADPTGRSEKKGARAHSNSLLTDSL